MTTPNLLSQDYLDILYTGRNKAYGSYELRRAYGLRARRALVAVVITAGVLSAYPVLAGLLTARPSSLAVATPPPVEIRRLEADVPPPPKPPVPVPPAPPAPTVKFPPPVVVPDDQTKPDDAPPTVDDLRDKAPGLSNSDGPGNPDALIQDPSGTGTGPAVVVDAVKPKTDSVHVFVDQMPQFPGDISAYLSRNLQYPDAAREAQMTGRASVRFVVNEQGAISDIHVLKDIGYGSRQEVERVVRAMPRWKPGKQNGVPVKVWYTLPVKFELGD